MLAFCYHFLICMLASLLLFMLSFFVMSPPLVIYPENMTHSLLTSYMTDSVLRFVDDEIDIDCLRYIRRTHVAVAYPGLRQLRLVSLLKFK